MKFAYVAALLAATLAVVTDATVLITTGAVTAGTVATAATLAGVGALAVVGGVAAGAALANAARGGGGRSGKRGGRGRRAVDAPLREELLLNVVAAADRDECAIKLVCLMAAQESSALPEKAQNMLSFATQEAGEPTVYQVAADIGGNGGHDSCQQEFPSCQYGFEEMMAYVREISE